MPINDKHAAANAREIFCCSRLLPDFLSAAGLNMATNVTANEAMPATAEAEASKVARERKAVVRLEVQGAKKPEELKVFEVSPVMLFYCFVANVCSLSLCRVRERRCEILTQVTVSVFSSVSQSCVSSKPFCSGREAV